MEKQPDISGDMRAILVDWMVEVQVCTRVWGGGMAFCRSIPTCFWCGRDHSVVAEVPVGVPSSELTLPFPRLWVSLAPLGTSGPCNGTRGGQVGLASV